MNDIRYFLCIPVLFLVNWIEFIALTKLNAQFSHGNYFLHFPCVCSYFETQINATFTWHQYKCAEVSNTQHAHKLQASMPYVNQRHTGQTPPWIHAVACLLYIVSYKYTLVLYTTGTALVPVLLLRETSDALTNELNWIYCINKAKCSVFAWQLFSTLSVCVFLLRNTN